MNDPLVAVDTGVVWLRLPMRVGFLSGMCSELRSAPGAGVRDVGSLGRAAAVYLPLLTLDEELHLQYSLQFAVRHKSCCFGNGSRSCITFKETLTVCEPCSCNDVRLETVNELESINIHESNISSLSLGLVTPSSWRSAK